MKPTRRSFLGALGLSLIPAKIQGLRYLFRDPPAEWREFGVLIWDNPETDPPIEEKHRFQFRRSNRGDFEADFRGIVKRLRVPFANDRDAVGFPLPLTLEWKIGPIEAKIEIRLPKDFEKLDVLKIEVWEPSKRFPGVTRKINF